MQLVFSLSFVKLLWPFVRITSYAHDQDHVHVHSHAILLHLEDSKYISHSSTNKTPCCAMFISVQRHHHNVWAIQKEIKDAYPKKVCHMPTRHVKKKERKDAYPKKVCHMPTRRVKKKKRKKGENIAHTKKKYSKGGRIHMKEFHPSFTKNINTLAHLDRGLWLVSPVDPVFNLAKYEKQVCHYIFHTYRSTKKKPIEIGWKKKGA